MTRDELASETARLTALYHDAYMIDVFGVMGSGLPDSRIEELREAGLIDDTETLTIEGIRPVEFMLGAGHVFGDQPERLAELREYGVEEFTPLVVAKLDDLRSMSRTEADARVYDPMETPTPPSEGGRSLSPPPPWMSPAERGAYQRLVSHAGEYIRGLGNARSAELEDVASEGWEGERIVEEVIPEQREEMLAMLREEAGRELATGRDARRLAGTLADRSQYYAHNWLRIAQTELQGAHNEGRVIASVEAYGEGARVARIPESGACDECMSLLTNEEGDPRVWRVDELQANGVNVGRRRAEWEATIFPIHPNCRCDTISVPEGFRVTSDGRLRRVL